MQIRALLILLSLSAFVKGAAIQKNAGTESSSEGLKNLEDKSDTGEDEDEDEDVKNLPLLQAVSHEVNKRSPRRLVSGKFGKLLDKKILTPKKLIKILAKII